MQGAERPTIIYSATATTALLARSEDFLLDFKRANVAMSRSEKRLIAIASTDLLDYTPADPDTYDSMKIWKYLRSFCNDKNNASVIPLVIDGTTVHVNIFWIRHPKKEPGATS